MTLARFVLFFLLSLSCLFSAAQDASIRKLQVESLRPVKKYVPDSLIKRWKSGGNYTLTIGQGTLSNWAAGGDQFSLTVNTILQLYSYYRKGRNSWDNTLDIFFGYINTTSLGSRKNDDRFDLISKYGYSLNKKINLATLFNIRSQFVRGYTYPNNIKTFALSSIKHDLNGLLLTLWDDDSPHFELYMRGIIAFSAYSWSVDKNSNSAIKSAYRQREFSYKVANKEHAFIDQLEAPVAHWRNMLLDGFNRNKIRRSNQPSEDLLIELPNKENMGKWSEK